MHQLLKQNVRFPSNDAKHFILKPPQFFSFLVPEMTRRSGRLPPLRTLSGSLKAQLQRTARDDENYRSQKFRGIMEAFTT